MGVGGKKKGIRILPIYYSNHSSTNDDLLSTTIPTRGKLRHSLVIIQTFLLFWLFVDETNSIRQLDRWINFTDFSLLFFFPFILFSRAREHPQDETKTVVVVVSPSKDDARMITTTTWRRLLRRGIFGRRGEKEFTQGAKRKTQKERGRERDC